MRSHYFNTNDSEIDGSVIDASSYSDMQDLLLASDVLITDYSSSSWDFSLQYKPCFLYMPDLDTYKKDFSFYNSIESLPYPKASTNEELMNNITEFNYEEFKIKLIAFYTEFGNFDNGKASEKLYNSILNGAYDKY